MKRGLHKKPLLMKVETVVVYFIIYLPLTVVCSVVVDANEELLSIIKCIVEAKKLWHLLFLHKYPTSVVCMYMQTSSYESHDK